MKRVLLTKLFAVSAALLGGMGGAQAAKSDIPRLCDAARHLDGYAKFLGFVVEGKKDHLFYQSAFQQNYTLTQIPEFQKINQALLTRGTRLVIVPIPPLGAVYGDLVDLSDPLLVGYSSQKAAASYNKMVSDLNSASIMAVNLLPTAKTVDASGKDFFFRRDVHMTPVGTRAAANLIASEIRSKLGSVASKLPITKYTLVQDKPVSQDGAGWQAKSLCNVQFPNETVPQYRLTSAQSSSLLGNEGPANVVLAGTSYSNRPQDHSLSTFLSYFLQSNVLNVALPASSSYDALDNYLTDPKYIKHKPKILLWEFHGAVLPHGGELREVLGSIYGACSDNTYASADLTADGKNSSLAFKLKSYTTNEVPQYMQITSDNSSLRGFWVTIKDANNYSETLKFDRRELIPGLYNSGNFFSTFVSHTPIVEGNVQVPNGFSGKLKLSMCKAPA